jgi:hypothetical protein
MFSEAFFGGTVGVEVLGEVSAGSGVLGKVRRSRDERCCLLLYVGRGEWLMVILKVEPWNGWTLTLEVGSELWVLRLVVEDHGAI